MLAILVHPWQVIGQVAVIPVLGGSWQVVVCLAVSKANDGQMRLVPLQLGLHPLSRINMDKPPRNHLKLILPRRMNGLPR